MNWRKKCARAFITRGGKNIEIANGFETLWHSIFWLFTFSKLYYRDVLLGLSQVYYWRYNGKKIVIYKNIDVTLFRTLSHLIIMIWKSGSTHRVKGQRFNKGKFYQSDRRISRLRKSLTDKITNYTCMPISIGLFHKSHNYETNLSLELNMFPHLFPFKM